MEKHIVIIGNGISGITCARHLRKVSNHKITVVSAESDHFYSRTALMYIYMGHLKYEHTKPYEDNFWVKNRIDLVKNFVQKVDTQNNEIVFVDGTSMAFDSLVIATGSKSNKFGWPGEGLQGVQSLYNLQDLELMEQNTKNISAAVIVGGGLIGIEMAEMLHSRKIPVTFLVREKHFWGSILPKEEADLIGRHIIEHGVDLRLGAELKEIIGDSTDKVTSVTTKDDQTFACQFVALTAGVTPNIGFIENSGIETDKGVLVDNYFETNIPGIYAIGDCAQFRTPSEGRRPVEQVWYTGRMHGETLALTINGEKTPYNPGHWFNSAKFFDIEYQTYGWVGNVLKENEASFYWEHAKGKMCFRAIYDKSTKQLVGINTFGIRMRHEVFDRWLSEGRDIDFVMEHLAEANFDPEFYRKQESKIIEKYNVMTGSSLKLKKSKGFLSTLFN